MVFVIKEDTGVATVLQGKLQIRKQFLSHEKPINQPWPRSTISGHSPTCLCINQVVVQTINVFFREYSLLINQVLVQICPKPSPSIQKLGQSEPWHPRPHPDNI